MFVPSDWRKSVPVLARCRELHLDDTDWIENVLGAGLAHLRDRDLDGWVHDRVPEFVGAFRGDLPALIDVLRWMLSIPLHRMGQRVKFGGSPFSHGSCGAGRRGGGRGGSRGAAAGAGAGGS